MCISPNCVKKEYYYYLVDIIDEQYNINNKTDIYYEIMYKKMVQV